MATQIIDALPDWANAVIQLNGLVAERLGVVPTDLHCLRVLVRGGPTTAGALAERVGLTPGSVSRMIDRLDAAGCVKRTPDPADRRKVFIEATSEGADRAGSYYAGLTARTRDDLAAFDDRQLRSLLHFVTTSRDSTVDEIRTLRSGSA